MALETKLYNYRKYGIITHPIWDWLVFNKVREVLGGQVRHMCVGGAPMDKTVLEFLRVTLSVPIIEGYGQTEGMGFQMSQVTQDNSTGHVGCPFSQNEFKLVDVPEMSYFSTDLDS